ncbi:A/G-specific adenine glycosylase [Pollutimonas bauzanensis]|uniref:Adenine DNA glycosylase n=1 Tax=Pollutimonas bauzanensis TaxID=658167 RepID=A0A1M5TPC5_9BURK|nr:A/G-specific adenine glycosylase [Pollutimonas bauzanensis]SHH52243.1 A/G-specific DNA-adenine glycosylase [Pollutimonas bauzanensis]
MFLNQEPRLAEFAGAVVEWQKRHGRHHLPWQGTRDAYRIWLSEIMLQQTQVATVVGYYERFLSRFPDIPALARASQDEVMPYWAGLGYYARARNLHRCAQELAAHWDGRFPDTPEQIATLPGIGRSTAAAIAAFAYGTRSPIMDGNVKRVFTRYFGIYGVSSQRATEQLLWKTAEEAVQAAPAALDMAAYTQGLMDLGSDCCTRGRPDCARCPLQAGCYAYAHGVQHELPTPKQKKASPERECKMLILHQEGSVLHQAGSILLEQQLSPGIWGGLWSLPQYGDASALEVACSNWGQPSNQAQKMAGLLHTFTHFKLHIEPWYVQCAATVVAEPGPRQAWVPVEKLASTALPAPVRKILGGLFDL